MKPSNKTALFKLFFLLALTGSAVLAFIPDYSALPPLVSFSDLLNHISAFTVLFLLLKGAYPAFSVRNIVILLFAYALWIEAIQYLLPTRHAAWSDIGADAAGLLTGYLIMILLTKTSITKDIFTR